MCGSDATVLVALLTYSQECYHGQFANDMPNGHGVLYSFEMDPQSGQVRERVSSRMGRSQTRRRAFAAMMYLAWLGTTRNEAKIEVIKRLQKQKMATQQSRGRRRFARQRAGDERKG